MAQSYGELQKQAKELGLPYTAVSRKALEASIAEKLGADKPIETPVEPVVTAPEPTVTEPVADDKGNLALVTPKEVKSKSKIKRETIQKLDKEVKKAQDVVLEPEPVAPVFPEPVVLANYEVEVPEDANTATIYDNRNKVRTYSVEQHGEEFAELAKSFLMSHPKYRVEYKNQKLNLKCSNCGANIKCNNCGQEIS
jgi:hypothetical protein